MNQLVVTQLQPNYNLINCNLVAIQLQPSINVIIIRSKLVFYLTQI